MKTKKIVAVSSALMIGTTTALTGFPAVVLAQENMQEAVTSEQEEKYTKVSVKNPVADSYFINFMCRPDIALRNMDFCGYVSSIATPEILEEKVDTTLDYYADLSYFFGPDADSIQIDKIQYPDRKVVERCAMIRDFGDKTKEVLDIWSRIKGDNLGVGITILIFVVVALMSGWMIYKRWQRYNRRKQQNRRSRRKRKKNVKR